MLPPLRNVDEVTLGPTALVAQWPLPPNDPMTMQKPNDSNNVIELFEDGKLWREHEAEAQRGANARDRSRAVFMTAAQEMDFDDVDGNTPSIVNTSVER